jgi:ubiquitin carboxyl-terminal hydrolase 25
MTLYVSVESATDMYQTGIGAHISQRECLKIRIAHKNLTPHIVAPGGLPDALVGYTALDEAWRTLGMSPATYSPGEAL